MNLILAEYFEMRNMYKSLVSSIFVSFLIFLHSCGDPQKTDEQLYDKFIFTDNKNKAKVKSGDKVTFYYCLKKGEEGMKFINKAAIEEAMTYYIKLTHK